MLSGEIRAILMGLQQVETRGCSNVIMCSDSQQAIQAILDDTVVRDSNYKKKSFQKRPTILSS